VISHSANRRRAAFTLVELLIGLAVFGLFMTGLLATWLVLTSSGLNATAYAARQNDQMRVFDYLKRDIRRATVIEIYNGGTLVTDTTTFGNELRLTIPDYYSDTREEDDVYGPKTTVAPTVTAGAVSYGTNLTVRYYATGGAVIRDESGTLRTVAGAAGAFAPSFKNETSGAIRCRLLFDQAMRGGSVRTLHRQVETVFVPRFVLQL
jgi:prepilin-type N-terminal cleavage/methylation domain-containing protein